MISDNRIFPVFIFLSFFSLVFSGLSSNVYAGKSKPRIKWEACFEDLGPSFECATVYVPLKHKRKRNRFYIDKNKHPHVKKIGIAMTRLPALDQENRKGSLFLNPGGPGGSGVDFLRFTGPNLFTPEVREKYDLIGFDPRGIGRSNALVCFEEFSEFDPLFARPVYPLNDEQVIQREQTDQYISDLCALRAGDIIDNMSTADVAKDLNLLRRAVGDRRLNFVGYSYGSYLGVTYANLFPRKVGSLVLDAVIDPVAWATGDDMDALTTPFSTRLRSDEGTMDTLNEFFRLCDEGGSSCAFSGGAASRFDAIAQSVRSEPIQGEIPGVGPILLRYDLFLTQVINALYNSPSWSQLVDFLVLVESNASPESIGDSLSAMSFSSGEFPEPPQVPQLGIGFAGVACADTDNPESFSAWATTAEQSEIDFGYFAPGWTWQSSICHSWPGSKETRFEGPFYTWTRKPALIVNTLFDPATPYHGAEVVEDLLFRSRLLTIDGWGHTSLFLSSCADQVVSDYLLKGALPRRGAVCRQDEVPFGGTYTLPMNGEADVTAPTSRASLQNTLSARSEEETSAAEHRRRALSIIRGNTTH